MSVGMPVWWSTQRGHVLRARFAAWRRIVVTSRKMSLNYALDILM